MMNSPPALQWEVLLGHLSSLEKLVPRGRLRLRSMQWQLKTSCSRRGRSSRSPSRIDSGGSRGSVLVDRGVPSSPGGSVRDSSSGSSSVHGRLLCGLGALTCSTKGRPGSGRRREQMLHHQSSRDEGSLARTAIFSEDSHRPSSDGNVRQLDGSSVCQQARRNAFSFHVRADKSPSQMDRGHRCPFGSEIPARTEQRPSGSLKPSGSGHCYGVDSPPSGGEGHS